jgi:alcohol dehydrogenase (cytochrome c)
MQTSPITYELDGRQYVLSGSGSVMFAWALPQAATNAGSANLSTH